MVYIPQLESRSLRGSEHQFWVESRAKQLIHLHRQHQGAYAVNFQGLDLVMLPEVFCPVYGEGSRLLAEVLTVQATDRVLELGTGSGALAILAARQGGTVVATDINPVAVRCATENAVRNGVEMAVRQGDLFEAIRDEEKFSLIIFNPPFMMGKPDSLLEVAMYDEDYRTLSRFFAEFPSYLTEGGRVLLAFSTAGDMEYLQQLIKASGFGFSLVNQMVNSLEFVVYEGSVRCLRI